MVCKFCKTALVDNSIYCHSCGKKQMQQTRKRRRRAQSQGTITKLSGQRAKPYWVRLPADYSSGVPKRKSLGCFPTYATASDALAKAMYLPSCESKKSSTENLTLQHLYNRFVTSHYYDSLSKSAQASHRSAWMHLKECAQIPTQQISKDTFQTPINKMETAGLKRETMAKVRNLASLLCKEAMGMGLIHVNYGQLVQLPKADSVGAKPFSSNDLKYIWNASDNGNVDAKTLLLMIYSGMRPIEMLSLDIDAHLHISGEHWYIRAGSKTVAGRNRLIPIPPILHDIIMFLIDNRHTGPLIATKKGGHYRVDTWRSHHFNPLMESLQLTGYVPYSARHTYADIQKRRKIDPELQMRIMGHTNYSTTVERYQTTTDEDIARICTAVADIQRP